VTNSDDSPPRRGRIRWAFWIWLVALPVLATTLYVKAATEPDAHARFHGVNGAIFIAGALVVPWVIGLLVLGWLAFRRRRPGA
jgi:hypothetical protein